jgi:hypothetical protein
MNYSSLVPVLKIVIITVLALIEVAPARTGKTPVTQAPAERPTTVPRTEIVEENGLGRAPVLRALVSVRDLGEHGYSSKLHLNSE